MTLRPVHLEYTLDVDGIPKYYGNIAIYTNSTLLHAMYLETLGPVFGNSTAYTTGSQLDLTDARNIHAVIQWGIRQRDNSRGNATYVEHVLAQEGKYAENLAPADMSDEQLSAFEHVLYPMVKASWMALIIIDKINYAPWINRMYQANWKRYVKAAADRAFWTTMSLLDVIRQQQQDSDDELDAAFAAHRLRDRRRRR